MKSQKKKSKTTEVKAGQFWEDGVFAETISQQKAEVKMKTFHKRHDEDMNFSCKKCKKKISAHNKDWHGCMCDDCFNKTYFRK